MAAAGGFVKGNKIRKIKFWDLFKKSDLFYGEDSWCFVFGNV